MTILFDGNPAPILYSSNTQINAVVPFTLGPVGTLVSIQDRSETIRSFKLPIAAAVPRLFTITGAQQALALNEDASINSSANPAAPGSVISIFVSGAGRFDQPLVDGQLGPLTGPFPVPAVGPVQGGIGNCCWMDSLFAAQVPGQVAGLVRVDLRVPDGTPAGSARISLKFGDYYTHGQTFVEIR